MIRQTPKQFTTRMAGQSIDEYAAVCNLENYTAVVCGRWKLIRGTDTKGNFTVILIGPYTIIPDLVGYGILIDAGFQPIDAMLALGIDRKHLRTMQRNHRNHAAQAKASPRMGSTTALDDL